MEMIFAAGEGIMIRVAGRFLNEFTSAAMKHETAGDENVGQHHIQTGEK